MTEDRSWTPIELSPGHAPPAGAFSPAVEAAGLVFVSGQVPRDPVSGQWVKDRPLEEQARRVFSNLALARRVEKPDYIFREHLVSLGAAVEV